jgi:hypothetical protein
MAPDLPVRTKNDAISFVNVATRENVQFLISCSGRVASRPFFNGPMDGNCHQNKFKQVATWQFSGSPKEVCTENVRSRLMYISSTLYNVALFEIQFFNYL